MKLRGETRTWPTHRLVPNPWNPNVQSEFMYGREKKSIQTFGFVDPITVRSSCEGKMFADEQGPLPQIIDGEHRHRAATDLGLREVLIHDLGDVSDAAAKALTEMFNALHGEPDKHRLARLLKDVVEADPTLVPVLPYDDDNLGELLALNDGFDWGSLSSEDPSPPKTKVHPRLILEFSTQEQADEVKRVLGKQSKRDEPSGDTLARLLIRFRS